MYTFSPSRSVSHSVYSKINMRSDRPVRCRRSSRPIVLSFASHTHNNGDVQIRVRGRDTLIPRTSFQSWLAGRTYIHVYILIYHTHFFRGSRQGKRVSKLWNHDGCMGNRLRFIIFICYLCICTVMLGNRCTTDGAGQCGAVHIHRHTQQCWSSL